MATNDDSIVNQIKAGKVDLAELEKYFSSETAADVVTVTGWEICYSSTTGQLSEYATITANSSAYPIIGVGMLAYSGDGTTMFFLQYDNGFSDPSISISIGTSLYDPQKYGNQTLCVVYGWTPQGSFYFPKTMTIQSC